MFDEIKKVFAEIKGSFEPAERQKLKRIVIGMVCGALAIWIVHGIIYDYIHYYTNQRKVEEQIWEQSATQLKKGHLGLNVNFSDIDINSEVMTKLQKNVTQAAEAQSKTYTISNREQQSINTASSLPDGYVTINDDKQTIEDNKIQSSSQELIKSGQIYFRNAYLGKFVSESGKFEVIIGQYNPDTKKYTVSDRNSFEQDYIPTFMESLEGLDESYTWLSEKEYMESIQSIMLGIYSPDYDKQRKDIDDAMNKFFTPDCKAKLLAQNTFDRSIIEEISLGYFDFGRSTIVNDYIDRVYVQLNMTVSGQKSYLDLELKLNDSGKIFDFDIL